MKKLIAIVLATVCVVAMVACNNPKKPQKRWDCTIICTEESSDNAYVVSYSDEKIISNTADAEMSGHYVIVEVSKDIIGIAK